MGAKKKSMLWIVFAAAAALFWGLYGPMLHRGQVGLGNPLRALLCVGIAYFLISILIPGGVLVASGGVGQFNRTGTIYSIIGGALGALGAIAVIWAFRHGGSPTYVMPLVFAGAPIINVLFTMAQHPPKEAPHPLLYAGFLLAAAGAGMVLYYKPQG